MLPASPYSLAEFRAKHQGLRPTYEHGPKNIPLLLTLSVLLHQLLFLWLATFWKPIVIQPHKAPIGIGFIHQSPGLGSPDAAASSRSTNGTAGEDTKAVGAAQTLPVDQSETIAQSPSQTATPTSQASTNSDAPTFPRPAHWETATNTPSSSSQLSPDPTSTTAFDRPPNPTSPTPNSVRVASPLEKPRTPNSEPQTPNSSATDTALLGQSNAPSPSSGNGSSSNLQPGVANGIPGGGGAGTLADAGACSLDPGVMQNYRIKVERQIDAQWKKLTQTLNEPSSGMSLIEAQFALNQQGGIVNNQIDITQSSNSNQLDELAKTAIRQSVPFFGQIPGVSAQCVFPVPYTFTLGNLAY